MRPRIVFIFFNVGPYHAARLSELAKRFKDIVVIELASSEKIRDWVSPDVDDLRKITLFDGRLEDAPEKYLCSMIRKTIEDLQPDCIVAAGYAHPAMREAVSYARRSKRIKTVLLSESQSIDFRRNPVREYIKGKWIRDHFDAAFAGGVSAFYYLSSLKFRGTHIWRGYTAVDNEWFSSRADDIKKAPVLNREKLGLPERFFLYIGRLAEEKNLYNLLEAYKLYTRSVSGAKWGLVFVGEGPLKNSLYTKSRELRLTDVYWAGFRQIEELPMYYGLAGGLILPSTREPWGLVVNEAMASGLPVLVSQNCGCALDLVYPGLNGWIFDPTSEYDIADSMKRLAAENTDLEAMQNASKEIVAKYSLSNWALSMEACIETVLQSRIEQGH